MFRKKLEEALENWREKLANYECEKSITASKEKEFELTKKIEDCDKHIKKLKERLKSLDEYRKLESGDIPSFTSVSNQRSNIDILVQQVRERRYEKIRAQCGTMRMLDISQPVHLANIYTDVNILEKPIRQQWKDVSDFHRVFKPGTDNFDRIGLGKVCQKRVPGLDVVSGIIEDTNKPKRLMILGKPGSGKTTFLQWVAIKCNLGDFQPQLVPIFIRLKSFAQDIKNYNSDSKLLDYISRESHSCGITDNSWIETILTEGRALILLDGWDEVSAEDGEKEVLNQIRGFVDKFFMNPLIITCRIVESKYKFAQENFTEVEIADFNQKQVKAFAQKWFTAIASNNNNQEKEKKANQFIAKLNQAENLPIRELAVTPILLNLTCFVFNEKGEFPSQRSKLYEEGLNILLSRWDKTREIKRDEVYYYLSVEKKKELLTHVGAITFEQSRYFFDKQEIEARIANYLRSLPNTTNAETGEVTLKEKSEAVLQSIEAQHGLLVERARGVYSFSHLTFQEYFTAKHLIDNLNPQILKELIGGLRGGRWGEVFLLATPMLDRDDYLQQLKSTTDEFLISNNQLQEFLGWVNEKTNSMELPFKKAAIRAFYLGVAFFPFSYNSPHDFGLVRRLDPNLDINSISERNSLLAFDYAIVKAYFARYLSDINKYNQEVISALSFNNCNLESQHINFFTEFKNKFSKLKQEEKKFEREIQPEIEVLTNSLNYLQDILAQCKDKNFSDNNDDNSMFKKLEDNINRAIRELVGKHYRDSIYLLDSIESVLKSRVLIELYNNNVQKQNFNAEINYFGSLKNFTLKINKLDISIQNTLKSYKKELEFLMSEHCNIRCDWQFNEEQKKLLEKYYDAHLWLVTRMNAIELAAEVRQKIEDSLLLPIDLVRK